MGLFLLIALIPIIASKVKKHKGKISLYINNKIKYLTSIFI